MDGGGDSSYESTDSESDEGPPSTHNLPQSTIQKSSNAAVEKEKLSKESNAVLDDEEIVEDSERKKRKASDSECDTEDELEK